MFLNNLAVQQQRKAGGAAKTSTGASRPAPSASSSGTASRPTAPQSSDGPVEESVFSFLALGEALEVAEGPKYDKGMMKRRMKAREQPIVYTNDKAVTEEVLLTFFKNCSIMLMDMENIKIIVDESEASKVPLFITSMEYQKDVLERNFQVEREYGVKQMGLVSKNYPDNTELINAASNFMLVAMESYVEQLKYRAAERFKRIRKDTGKDAVLRTGGGLSKTDFLEFLEGCNALMPLEKTQARLREEWKACGSFTGVGAAAVKMQHRMLELIGVDQVYGVRCLNELSQKPEMDKEIQMKFFSFQTSSETFCRMATMSEEEKVDYLREVPDFLKALPHLFFMRNQQALQRANALKNGSNPNGLTWDKIHQLDAQARARMSAGDARAQQQMDPRLAEDQRKLVELLNSPDGQQKIASLTDVVETTKDEIMADIKDWDEARRKQYFDEFSQSGVVESLRTLQEENMLARVQMFIDMPKEQLRQILTMNAVFNQDARSGGSLLRNMTANKEQGGAVQSSMRHFSTIARMFGGDRGHHGATRGGLKPGGVSSSHSHAHSDNQCSDPHCTNNHNLAKDVTSGSSESMDR